MVELSSWGSWECDVPSTGKSSNSSSSSNAAAGFCWSLRVEESVESETVAFVVGPEPSAAADIMARNYSGLVRRKWTRMIGSQRFVQSSVLLSWTEKAPVREACPKAEAWRATSMTQATPH